MASELTGSWPRIGQLLVNAQMTWPRVDQTLVKSCSTTPVLTRSWPNTLELFDSQNILSPASPSRLALGHVECCTLPLMASGICLVARTLIHVPWQLAASRSNRLRISSKDWLQAALAASSLVSVWLQAALTASGTHRLISTHAAK